MPENWTKDGILDIGVFQDGMAPLKESTQIAFTSQEHPEEVLLTLHLVSEERNYRLCAPKGIHLKGSEMFIAKETVQSSSEEETQQFRLAWHRLASEAKLIAGDLVVPRGYLLEPGTYLVRGNVRFEGGTRGNITILSEGKIIIKSSDVHFRPMEEEILFLSRGGIFLLGSESAYEGKIISLNGEIRAYGKGQTFFNGGMFAPEITLKGRRNAILTTRKNKVETE